MSQLPSTEEILERMRVHVSQRSLDSHRADELHAGANKEHLLQTTPGSRDQEVTLSASVRSEDFSPLRREIETALEGTRQVGQLNPRNPGLHNSVIQFVKKIMRRSLSWYTRPLHLFQGGAIRALQQILILLEGQQESLKSVSKELVDQAAQIEHISRESSTHRDAVAQEISGLSSIASTQATNAKSLSTTTAALEQKTSALENKTSVLEQRLRQAHMQLGERLSRMEVEHEEQLNQALVPHTQRIEGIIHEIGSVWSELERVKIELREAKIQRRMRDRDLRRFFHDIEIGSLVSCAETRPSPERPIFSSGIKNESQFDYFRFEEIYRGDESLIATRQKEYLELFRGRENVLDVGCGRGEFLELLRENGISARGVELGTDQYLLCREKALEVEQQDLFAYLEALPDESLGGIFSAQVIEHLSASDQLYFVSLAYQKTRPGAPVVLETINAQCVFAVMRNFLLDPTHVRPVHPETLKFAMESVRFRNVELRFSSPMLERQIPALKLNGDSPQLVHFNRAIAELNQLLYGDMDYAAIGWR